MPKTPALKDFRRIVVKVGSSLLVDHAAGSLKRDWLASLAADIAALHKDKRDILVVSSGAIALARATLKLPTGALRLEEAQAAAAVGQIELARSWSESLSAHGIAAGQVLLTLGDTEERRRYLNARETIDKLLEWRSVPVINENDTVATTEIRYGDNDRLAARVATMTAPICWCCCPTSTGSTTSRLPPATTPNTIAVVPRITPEIEAMAGASGSELSRGGMVTKIEAGKIATTAGTHMVIASGRVMNPLRAIIDGALCTWFLTPANPVTVAQEMDRRFAGAARRAAYRCRRGQGAALGQEPAAGRRHQNRRRVRARRRGGVARSRRRRSRARADRL